MMKEKKTDRENRSWNDEGTGKHLRAKEVNKMLKGMNRGTDIKNS